MLIPTSSVEVLDRERPPQRLDQALGRPAGHRQIGRPEQQNGELVAAQTGDRVGAAQRLLQTRADLGQQPIADLVTEGVVDVLEAIEIQQQHGHLLARPLRVLDRLLDPVVEQGAIGQPGQRVVQRHALELGFLELAFGDIAQDRDTDPFFVDLHAAEGGLDREGPPGAMPCFELVNAARLRERS